MKKGGNIMQNNVKPSSTTVGMLGHMDVLVDGQRDTIEYKTEEEQIKQPMPAQDPIQNLWVDPAIATVMGQVENEKPEVEDETKVVGEEKIRD